MLTAAELNFLKVQGLSAADVYDGRNQSATRWKAGVRAAGLTLVLGTSCSRGSHRLRTRSGHCAQCDTRNLAYQSRHHSDGYVYIAGSRSTRLLKIGTAVDIQQRQSNLRKQAYAAIDDWEILYYVKVENGGQIEGTALRSLKEYQVKRPYEKDGNMQEAAEVLKTTFTKALDAISTAVGGATVAEIWKVRYWAEYNIHIRSDR